MQHPLIIGAGGVASYLLPVLIRAFRPAALTIIDKDVLEPRNLDRQLFHPGFVGRNKAEALVATCNIPEAVEVTILREWFSDSTELPDGIDGIFCVADNHLARLEAIQLADRANIRVYLGGNEYFDNEAYVYDPLWKDGTKDPRVRYPSILTDHEGSPLNCTGAAQIATPQLALANLGCAAKLLHLAWTYERWLPENRSKLDRAVFESIRTRLPYELYSSVYETGQRASQA